MAEFPRRKSSRHIATSLALEGWTLLKVHLSSLFVAFLKLLSLQAMQNKSMVSRGMAVLGAGGQCTREAHRRETGLQQIFLRSEL